MPRTRKTFDERIGLLSGKRSEIDTRIETLRSRQNGSRGSWTRGAKSSQATW